ncbi:MAG: hypothetical protein L0271_02685 [Gemmatimonadetes bacterium]|nr:hypothetical protein [Gemmatimonadota bacterium]
MRSLKVSAAAGGSWGTVIASFTLLLGTAAIAHAQASPVLTHLGHVREAFRGTPEGKGLLPTAIAEAEMAARHAALATRSTENLEAMKTHAAHVLHAIEPAEGMTGPGLGYGLKKAVSDVVTHIELAAQSEGAPEGVTAHAGHITASATNTLARADQMVTLVRQIQGATTTEQAATLVAQLNTLGEQLVAGVDANGDGRTGWQEGEGGLQHVRQHVDLMAQAASGTRPH